MSGYTGKQSKSGRNRCSKENRPQQTYRQRWDRGSDIELSKKDDEIKRLQKRLNDFNGENYDLKQQIMDTKEVIENNNREIEEKNRQLTKFNNSLKVCTQKITTLEKENTEQLTKIGELTQELAKEMLSKQHLNSYITQHNTQLNKQLNSLTESYKKQDSTIKMLNAINNNLYQTLNQKKAEMEDMTKDFENKIKDIESEADKYRIKTNKELKDMNKEIQKLKKSRKYLEDDKNHHKQKVVAVSHSAVKQRELYTNAIQKVARDNMKVNEEIFEDAIHYIKDLQNKSKRKMTENLAKTNADIMKERDNIYKKQQKMEQKRADGRETCDSCDNTYTDMKDFRTHMKVTHIMNTKDINKNEPQFIRNKFN